jgi:hypothetical protein
VTTDATLAGFAACLAGQLVTTPDCPGPYSSFDEAVAGFFSSEVFALESEVPSEDAFAGALRA